MSKTTIAVVLAAAIAAAAAGYWFGTQRAPSHAPASADAGSAPADKGGKKILYYRNPMGLPDTSPTPKKDPMGMDYVPVYEGEDAPSGGSDIKISPDRVQKLGVRTEPAARRQIVRAVRAVGRVEVNERLLATITPKFEGYIERLYINATGQAVARGAPLFDAYSPELLAAQREYAIAVSGLARLKDADAATAASMNQLADSALVRMRLWDVTAEEIARLTAGGEPRRALTFRAPVSGIVLERKATLGMRFIPGEMLYQIADLSNVWVLADVPEQDIGLVKPGTRAQLRINAYPDRRFEGRVTFIYPTLAAATRTVPVRIELANPGGLLKPAMYVEVELSQPTGQPLLTVPTSAVLDSGVRRVVLVATGEGRFASREVKLGQRSSDFVEVLDGVKEGEAVVVAANFLIDAESNLKAALRGLQAPPSGQPGAGKVGHTAEGTIEEVDAKTQQILIRHGAVPTLKWPAMAMEFKAANEALLKDAKPGTRVRFEFVERQPGEWVVVKIERAGEAPAAAPAGADAHKQH